MLFWWYGRRRLDSEKVRYLRIRLAGYLINSPFKADFQLPRPQSPSRRERETGKNFPVGAGRILEEGINHRNNRYIYYCDSKRRT